MKAYPRMRRLIVPVAAALLAACAGTPAPAEHIRLPMGYIPNVQFAPFYVGMENGYFREAGIELELDQSFETDGVKLVGAGELPFSLVSGEQVLLARAQGLPVVYVMAWWQDYPVAVAAPADSGIRTPQDLAGRRIGIPGLFGASYVGYRALLHAAGLPENAATLDSIGFNQVEALAVGQEEAVVVYANNEPLQLEARGLPVNVIRVADYVQLASNGLLSSEATLRDRPALVRAMVRATLRGVEQAIADPQAAFEICKKYVEGLAALSPAEQDTQRAVLAATIEFWRSDRPGYSDPAAWENMHALLLEMGLLADPLDIQQAFTNDYLP
ncbi:MAG TPA: ABC transporter substrate-binding protein [Anaerolineales bacterium]|nr:ABC transporter substrate-binding protein [Anaerolineales bacterium]